MEARRRATAIHEAGHGVAAVAFGGEITSVSIAADGTTGVCFHRGAYTTREEAAICAAGHAAEHLYRGRSAIRLPMAFDPHPELPSDVEKLEAMGDAADGAYRDAARVLLRYEDAVEGLASLLIRRTSIDGPTATIVVRSYVTEKFQLPPLTPKANDHAD